MRSSPSRRGPSVPFPLRHATPLPRVFRPDDGVRHLEVDRLDVMTGWRPLITATVRLANRNGTRLRRRAAEGRLLLEPAGAVPTPTVHRRRRHSVQPPDYVRGVLAGAWTLSAEICHDCGGPGDPVSGASGRRSTRCADCRAPGDQALPRSASQRQREPDEAGGLLEDLAGTEDLAALMEARYTPTTHPGWPVRTSALRRASTVAAPAGCADQAGCTRRVTAVRPSGRSASGLDLAL